MLRLVNADLPTQATPLTRGASGFRLYNGSPHLLAPFVRYNRYANFQQPGFAPTTYAIDIPDFCGLYYRISLGFSLFALHRIYSSTVEFSILNTPLLALPNHAWTDAVAVNLYAYTDALTVGEPIALQITGESITPAPNGFQYSVSLADWGNLSITQSVSTGLNFTPAIDSNSPQPGEFTYANGTLTLYGSNAIRPTPGQPLYVTGTLQTTVPEPAASVHSFDLSTSGIEFVDGIDYLGINFTPASQPLNPSVREFFWFDPILTVFVDLNIGRGITCKPKQRRGMTTIGSTDYVSYS